MVIKFRYIVNQGFINKLRYAILVVTQIGSITYIQSSGAHAIYPSLYFEIPCGVAANVGRTNLQQMLVKGQEETNQWIVVPIGIVCARGLSEQLLLSVLVGQMPTHKISILLCRQHRNQVDSRPHLLACKLTKYLLAPRLPNHIPAPGPIACWQSTYFCSLIPCPTLQKP